MAQMENLSDFSHVGQISSLTEIDELEFEDDEETSKHNNESNIPAYEKELRNLFGKETADKFVHPKIDESIGVAGMTASLRSQRIAGVTDRKRYKRDSQISLLKIQTNANRLWNMLRENSVYNIQKEDSKLDPSLKGSFNAFARGFINRNMTPPQRSFVEDDELLNMRERMKSKRVINIDLNSRKKHLMFDLSELQEGNQAMLLRDKSFLKTDELSIKELLFPPIINNEEDQSKELNNEKTRGNLEQILSNKELNTINEKHKESMNIKFFSEEDSLKILNERNLFRDHINKKIGENVNIMDQMIDKSRRQMEDDERARSRERERYESESKGKHKWNGTVSNSTKKENPQALPWQPLTLGAVMDFKVTKKPTFIFDDDGQFRQGACRLWRPKLALT